MAVDSSYIAWRVQTSAIPYVRTYGEYVLRDVMGAFSNLEKRADEVADAALEHYGSQPAGENFDGDMSVFAERAEDKGIAFYEMMSSLRQTTLNLFAAGLFHLVEQQLANLCHDASFDVPPPSDTKLSVVASWYGDHFLLELQQLPAWPTIDEMRLVANVVKHAEGRLAEDLRDVRPELFEHPQTRDLLRNGFSFVLPVRMPLAGADLYVTEDLLRSYGEAANQFFADIATHFETHGDEYYPR